MEILIDVVKFLNSRENLSTVKILVDNVCYFKKITKKRYFFYNYIDSNNSLKAAMLRFVNFVETKFNRLLFSTLLIHTEY